MKSFTLALAGALLWLPTLASAQVGVSVSIGQPGFYGTIDIGDYPRPRLVFNEPLIIERVRVGSPVYLHVPPGHAKNWGKHCGRYNACSRPVYFVDNNWYQNTYVPAYQSRHGNGKGKYDGNHGGGKHHDKGGKHKGNGHGNGKGNGKN